MNLIEYTKLFSKDSDKVYFDVWDCYYINYKTKDIKNESWYIIYRIGKPISNWDYTQVIGNPDKLQSKAPNGYTFENDCLIHKQIKRSELEDLISKYEKDAKSKNIQIKISRI
jgi:hypothetical protein